MAKTTRQAEFDRIFGKQIERFHKPVTSALRKITGATLPPVIKILSFEMQSDWRTFPVYLFSMDDEGPNEVYFDPPFNGRVLPKSEALVPKGVIDQEAFEADGIDTFVSGARILAEWFGECWHEAGGAKFPIPAYINLHDGSRYYDLRKLRWVRDSDTWPDQD